MKNTKAVGDITEAVIMSELLKQRQRVLLPFGEGHKYDLVIDRGGHFLRVQCKTGRLKKGTLWFNTFSVIRDAATKKWVKRYYSKKDVDLYGVYCPSTMKCYLVPVGDVARTTGSLRVEDSKISKACGGREAKKYELGGWVNG